ncbi:transmembrane protein 45B-like isoform X2 [Palaemon carinicauda]|uniref:transmembrane protein 45B-like isoform X2 n=1 Tax=Palaemon carinicauda TaxID=392227 RepID=UPI0035B6957A
MGTFLGHVLPGSFFILYASWLMFHVFTKYFLGQRAVAGTTTRENGSSPTAYKRELITGFEDGVFVHYGNAQHMTMYSFFGMSGAFDILVFRGLRAPPNLDYITLIIAFAIEALLFGYHLHGRTPLDIQVHMFMLYAIIFCAVATAIEMMYKRKVLPALMRVYFVMLQGTWFIQVGSILYMPLTTPWDENSHTHMMLATVLFCCHIGGVFLLMASVGWILSRRVKKMLSTSVYCQLGRRTDKSKMTQAEALDALGDSEEEV